MTQGAGQHPGHLRWEHSPARRARTPWRPTALRGRERCRPHRLFLGHRVGQARVLWGPVRTPVEGNSSDSKLVPSRAHGREPRPLHDTPGPGFCRGLCSRSALGLARSSFPQPPPCARTLRSSLLSQLQ